MRNVNWERIVSQSGRSGNKIKRRIHRTLAESEKEQIKLDYVLHINYPFVRFCKSSYTTADHKAISPLLVKIYEFKIQILFEKLHEYVSESAMHDLSTYRSAVNVTNLRRTEASRLMPRKSTSFTCSVIGQWEFT